MTRNIKIFAPKSPDEWRNWLSKNFDSKETIWVKVSKKNAATHTLSQGQAVDEALCFGWIDGTARSLDEEHFLQSFVRRKPKSVWSKINKEKVSRFIAEGRMAPSGMESIEVAKANGYWAILDDVEALVIPSDLRKALKQHPEAQENFNNLSRSSKKSLLQSLALAQRPETREKRVQAIIEKNS